MSNVENAPPPEEETHESYAMVGLYRTHNSRGTHLFGSALKEHASTMRLRIVRAKRIHDMSHDRYYGGDELIEIEMSSAQFAEFVTTPNMGNGVPCTLRSYDRKSIDDPPIGMSEVERVRSGFAQQMRDFSTVHRQQTKRILDLAKSLGAKTKREIEIALQVMTQQLESNAPFVVDQFHEAAERVVTAAKLEIEAFTTNVLHAAGMHAIANGDLPKLLAASVETPAFDVSDVEGDRGI